MAPLRQATVTNLSSAMTLQTRADGLQRLSRLGRTAESRRAARDILTAGLLIGWLGNVEHINIIPKAESLPFYL